MTKKLVSAITGTYNRTGLVIEGHRNLEAQTYPNLEHVIVSESDDEDEIARLDGWIYAQQRGIERVPITYQKLGRRWSGFLAASISTVPFQVAQWLAKGDYLMWCSDDERFHPEHVEKLVKLLEDKNVDFVYSQCQIYFGEGIHKPYHMPDEIIIGQDPPVLGAVTNCLYRKELLDYRGFTTHIGSGTDWDQVKHWMQAGASWAFLEETTMSHRVDKNGEGREFKINKQPLRGHTHGSTYGNFVLS